MDALRSVRLPGAAALLLASTLSLAALLPGAASPADALPATALPATAAPATALPADALPATAAPGVLALTTDWSRGGVSALSTIPPFTARTDLAVTCGDAVGRWYQGRLYVVNRRGCDDIEVLDPSTGWSVEREFSVGPGTNPQDIAFVSPTRAYVSRYESNWLLEVDPSTGAILDSLSLAVLADSADGLCEMHRMQIMGDRLFVEIQRLSRRGFPWIPVPPSVLAVVDLASRTLIDPHPETPGLPGVLLEGTNPDAPMQVESSTGYLLVPEAGENGKLDAGGVERVDPVGLRSDGFWARERELGGDLVDFSQWSDSLGYAVVADSAGNTALLALDPRTGHARRTLYKPGGYVLFDCLATPSGLLYLADQTYADPGVRVFDAPSARLLSEGAVRTGRPPFELLLWNEPVLPDSGEVSSGFLGQPWPNPSRGSFRIRWPAGRAQPLQAGVFSVSGRLVRNLDWSAIPAGETPGWDGKDASGRPAPAGAYLFRIRSGDGTVLLRRASLVR